jgi:hypothetical protein
MPPRRGINVRRVEVGAVIPDRGVTRRPVGSPRVGIRVGRAAMVPVIAVIYVAEAQGYSPAGGVDTSSKEAVLMPTRGGRVGRLGLRHTHRRCLGRIRSERAHWSDPRTRGRGLSHRADCALGVRPHPLDRGEIASGRTAFASPASRHRNFSRANQRGSTRSQSTAITESSTFGGRSNNTPFGLDDHVAPGQRARRICEARGAHARSRIRRPARPPRRHRVGE